MIAWSKPSQNFIRFNSDASFHDNMASLGVVAIDEFGNKLGALGKILKAESPKEAKARALALAVGLPAAKGLKRVVIESDCVNIIEYMQGKEHQTSWQAKQQLEELNSTLSRFECIFFKWIPRACNVVANNISRWVMENKVEGSFSIEHLPQHICHLVNVEYYYIYIKTVLAQKKKVD